MALNWLMGRPVVREGWGGALSFGSSFTITISDVQEIVDRLKLEGASEVKIWKLHRGMQFAPWMEPTQYEVELNPNSVADNLAAIGIVASWPPSESSMMSATIYLGSRVPANVMISELNTNAAAAERVAERIAEVITASRRRIPSWKWIQIARVVGGALLAVLGLWAAVTLRSTPAVALVAVAAVAAFGLEVSPRLMKLADGKPAGAAKGVVSVDATLLEKVRTDRRQRHTNWRVSSVSVAATLVAAVLTAWFTGIWAPGS
jgi:hypothetical protein